MALEELWGLPRVRHRADAGVEHIVSSGNQAGAAASRS